MSISNLDDLDELTDDLLEALKQAKDINEKNDQLSNLYGGNFAFVKTYKDCIETDSDVDNKKCRKDVNVSL